MSYSDFIHWLRLADALLAALVFGLMIYKGRRFWGQYSDGQKWMYSAFTMYTAAVSYTSYELFQQHVQVGLRSYLILAANLTALYALSKYNTKSNNHPSGSSVG